MNESETLAAYEALGRLLDVARRNSGQAGRVATFLLAWHNAEENGAWDPVDLWSFDAAIADDILLVLRLIRECHQYPEDIGFENEIKTVWKLWRGGKTKSQ